MKAVCFILLLSWISLSVAEEESCAVIQSTTIEAIKCLEAKIATLQEQLSKLRKSGGALESEKSRHVTGSIKPARHIDGKKRYTINNTPFDLFSSGCASNNSTISCGITFANASEKRILEMSCRVSEGSGLDGEIFYPTSYEIGGTRYEIDDVFFIDLQTQAKKKVNVKYDNVASPFMSVKFICQFGIGKQVDSPIYYNPYSLPDIPVAQN